MGKRKIGEIYNKPIIEGDINLKTPNEIHKSELSGVGGANNSEVKEWYYEFDSLQFAKDNDLKLNGASDAHQEEMNMLNNIIEFTSPITKIKENEVGSKYVPYETLNTKLTLFELRRIIYFKYNENYYFRMGFNDSGEHGTVLAVKGSLDDRFAQMDKMGQLFGYPFPDLSKYFKITSKEEYDSKLNATELMIDEVLDLIG